MDMAGEGRGGSAQQQEQEHEADGSNPLPLWRRPPGEWAEAGMQQYQRLREHRARYPYVWTAYLFVYGSLGAYFALRWRQLRQSEREFVRLQDEYKSLREVYRKSSQDASSSSATATAAARPSGSTVAPSSSSTSTPTPSNPAE